MSKRRDVVSLLAAITVVIFAFLAIARHIVSDPVSRALLLEQIAMEGNSVAVADEGTAFETILDKAMQKFDQAVVYDYTFSDHQSLIDWCRNNDRSPICLDDKAIGWKVPVSGDTTLYGLFLVAQLQARPEAGWQFARVKTWPGRDGYDVAILVKGPFPVNLSLPMPAYLFGDHGDDYRQTECLPLEEGRITVATRCWPEDNQLIVRAIPFGLGGQRLTAFFDRNYSAACDTFCTASQS